MGALAGTLGLAAAQFVPHPVAAGLTLGAGIALTGALHLDGFLDGCDAFFASASPERRREILKDPRHGTFAVAGMFVAGSLWFASLLALPPRAYPAFAAYAGALARLAALANAYAYPYAGDGAAARAFEARPAIGPLLVQGALLCIAGFAIAPPFVAAVPLASAIALVLGRSICERLGGAMVGDAYGFIIVVIEVGTLVTLSAAGTSFG